ncbi:MAG: SDR family NAD(P)-dependent oxidoreductase [Spirochaetota bacterium]|nr:SDR family NAD(P)-dependent oxidoreductase [Spirochaetota bacterium]
MNSMENWRGRVALITGASSGIGYQTAKQLYEAGMKVVVCARRLDRLQQLGEELKADPDSFLPVRTDVGSLEEVHDLFNSIRKKWGGVDVLINNAGLSYSAPILDGRYEKWKEMVDVNLLGLCSCVYEAAADMRNRGTEGYIILISSLSAHRHKPGTIGYGVYVATKWAVRALTESLRQELHEAASGVRISSISPGNTETEFAAHHLGDEKLARDFYSRIRNLQPEDIADCVMYLLSTPPHVQVHDIIVRPTEQEF